MFSKFYSTVTSYTLIVSILLSSSIASISFSDDKVISPPTDEEKLALANAVNPSAQEEALRLLILAAIVSTHVNDITEVAPEVERRYQQFRSAVYGSVPMLGVTLATAYSARACAEELQSIFKPFTIIFKAIGEVIWQSGKSIGEILENLGVWKALENSSRTSYNIIAPIVEILVTKGGKWLVATSSGIGLLGTSAYMSFKPTARDTLGDAQVRSLLGYDLRLASAVEKITEDVSAIYSFDGAKANRFRRALADEAFKQALENNFSKKDDYDVNIVKILSDNELVSTETLVATRVLREIFKGTTRRADLTEVDKLVSNLAAIQYLRALLGTLADSGKLNAQDEGQVRVMLAQAEKTITKVENYGKALQKIRK